MTGDAPNTLVRYLYRDASNHKQWGEAVFAGRATAEQLRRLAANLDEGVYLIAEQVGLPDLRERWPARNDDDHVWHELDLGDIEPTAAEPNQPGTFAEFAERVATAVWDEDAAIERLEQRDTPESG